MDHDQQGLAHMSFLQPDSRMDVNTSDKQSHQGLYWIEEVPSLPQWKEECQANKKNNLLACLYWGISDAVVLHPFETNCIYSESIATGE